MFGEGTPCCRHREECWLEQAWNAAFDLGVKHRRGLQALSRVMGHHGRGVKPCPLCDVPGPFACLLDHVLKDHWDILELGNDLLTRESLLTLVVDCSISYVPKFRKLFSSLNTLHVNSISFFMSVLVLFGRRYQ